MDIADFPRWGRSGGTFLSLPQARAGYLVFTVAALLGLLFTGSAVAGHDGPLSSQNRFPLHLIFLTPRPVPISLPPQGVLHGTVGVAYSSTYFQERGDQFDILVDLEMTVVDIGLRYGLTPRTALHLNVPLVSMNSGFLDGFLESYHDALGVSNYGRENRPRNQFAYRILTDDQLWFEGQSGAFCWTDITLSLQWAFAPSVLHRVWASTLMASLKLPTGDAGRGYGSGRFDVGIFLPTQWSNDDWTLYGMPGYMWRGNPDPSLAVVKAGSGFSLFCGVAYAYSEKWRWLVQLDYFTSPLMQTGIDRLDDGALELALGFQRRISSDWSLEFVFCEDPLTLAAPDFNIRMALVWHPDGKVPRAVSGRSH